VRPLSPEKAEVKARIWLCVADSSTAAPGKSLLTLVRQGPVVYAVPETVVEAKQWLRLGVQTVVEARG